jgi:hypothetical protein
MAIEDDTWVKIDNNPLVKLTKGLHKAFDIPGTANAMYIKSTKPVYAYQVSGLWNSNGNEMGSALLPTIKCTGLHKGQYHSQLRARAIGCKYLHKRKI